VRSADLCQAVRVICKDRLDRQASSSRTGRGIGSVAADIEKVLEPKNLDELVSLEKTVKQKLDSNEPIDEEYWEQLLSSIGVFKAKAELDKIFRNIIDALHDINRRQNVADAERAQRRYQKLVTGYDLAAASLKDIGSDPKPMSSIPTEDKGLRVFAEKEFLAKIVS
jgi:Conserved mid region of cactin